MQLFFKLTINPETEQKIMELIKMMYGELSLPPDGEVIPIDVDELLKKLGISIDYITTIAMMYKKMAANQPKCTCNLKGQNNDSVIICPVHD